MLYRYTGLANHILVINMYCTTNCLSFTATRSFDYIKQPHINSPINMSANRHVTSDILISTAAKASCTSHCTFLTSPLIEISNESHCFDSQLTAPAHSGAHSEYSSALYDSHGGCNMPLTFLLFLFFLLALLLSCCSQQCENDAGLRVHSHSDGKHFPATLHHMRAWNKRKL